MFVFVCTFVCLDAFVFVIVCVRASVRAFLWRLSLILILDLCLFGLLFDSCVVVVFGLFDLYLYLYLKL